MKAVLAGRLGQSAGQLDGGGEVGAPAQLADARAQRDRQVGLADARRTQEHDVAALGAEAGGGQLVDQPAVDGRLCGIVEVLQPLEVRKPRQLQRDLDRAPPAFFQFTIQQTAQKVRVAPTAGGGPLGGLIQVLMGDLQSQVLQSLGGFGFKRNAHDATSIPLAVP